MAAKTATASSNKSSTTVKDTPKPRFCLVCEEVVISTERDFMGCGHVNNVEHATKKYALSKTAAAKVVARLRSGQFGSEYRTLEVKGTD